MINTLFDQYQRYNNVRSIINKLRVDDETFHILEVGANEHRNLEKFLPLDKITYLDIQLPDELLQDQDYILGDATAMDFPDNYYDVIVALDVFEHIPVEKRNLFIDELYRVSSQVCIITAPFHSQQSVEAESRVNAVFKSIFGKNFIWLEEHMDNGLPNQEVLMDYLNSKDISYKMYGHGNIDIWERLMGVHFFAAKIPVLASYRQEIDKFYNANIFDYDFTDESYRKIAILEKGRILKLPFEEFSGIPKKTLEKLEVMESTFYNLCSMVGQSNRTDLSIDKVQIFVDSGQGFTEFGSKDFLINDKESTKSILADLHDFGVVKSIRIDPSNYGGFYRIENLRLIGVANNTEVKYHVSGNFDLETSGLYLFEKDDPNIVLNLESEMDKLRIEFQVSKLSITEIVNQYVNTISCNNEFKDKLEKIAAREHLLEKENKDQQEVNGILKNNVAEISEMVEGLNSQIVHLSALSIVDKTENQRLLQKLEDKESELSNIYNSKAWKVVVRARKIFGK